MSADRPGVQAVSSCTVGMEVIALSSCRLRNTVIIHRCILSMYLYICISQILMHRLVMHDFLYLNGVYTLYTSTYVFLISYLSVFSLCSHNHCYM